MKPTVEWAKKYLEQYYAYKGSSYEPDPKVVFYTLAQAIIKESQDND